MERQFDLQEHLRKLIAASPLSQNEIANQLGLNSGYISKFLNRKQEIAFWMFHKLVTYLDKDNELMLMTRFCENMSRKENLRVGLEYAHSKNLKGLMSQLIEKCSIDKNEENREWAIVYEWQLNSKSAVHYNLTDYVSDLNGIKAKTIEMKALLKILEMYCFFFDEKYEIAYYHVKQAENLIREVSDSFIQKSFGARLNEALGYIYLKYKNDVVRAREAAYQLAEKDLGPNYLVTAFFVLGLSYFKESFDKTVFFYKKALEISSKIGRVSLIEDINEQIDFACLYWGKAAESSFDSNNFIKLVSEKNDLKDYYNHPKYAPYAYLYDGIKESNKEKLFMSMNYFLSQRDKFRASIPELELRKLGVEFTAIKGGEYV